MHETYFTCTLGQATRLDSRQKDFKNIPNFLEQQAERQGSLPAVGFYIPSSSGSDWQTKILTFAHVQIGVTNTARFVRDATSAPERQTVALICSSNVKFLFLWLALMHLGHPVLLIAPQCTPKAIVELCKQSNVSYIFHDDVHKDLAMRSVKLAFEEALNLSLQPVPFQAEADAYTPTQKTSPSIFAHPDIEPTDVAYLHHTSGTSSGIPKPIPQSHKAGAGVQAEFDGTKEATFTTTPLYHGGIADLFRAWTSNSLIWLFPSKELPITANNVIKCLEASEASSAPPVRYFSSVPYVLEMMATDPSGLKRLQEMDIVGVGGAALPVEIGDRLAQQGVNLVSRYGSAECGFLMSSHRDYDMDKEWQYVRPGEGIEELRFEKRGDGLSELVVLPGWPHMAKTNRDDGSFVSSDLFMPHSTIKNAWRYHSRADAQLTLITGKKFDPSPLESSLAASTLLLNDVLVFGNGKPYPGAFLFRSEQGRAMSDNDLIDALAQTVERLNTDSQSHARIPRNMIIPMPFSEQPLEKSSKGTILRNQAEARYASDISEAYDNVGMSNEKVPDDEVEQKILEIVRTIMAPSHQSDSLDAETDLFAYGVDSVASVQIRHALTRLMPKDSSALPMTLVQDSGTVHRLAEKILSIRHGRTSDAVEGPDQHKVMQELVDEYGRISLPERQNKDAANSATDRDRNRRTVLLTGATGSIGSHLLTQLVSAPNVRHVHLLLRGATQKAAEERVRKALEYRKLDLPTEVFKKISIHTAKIGDPRLGLSEVTFDMLAREVDLIYHLAWSVDFLFPVMGFRQHFAGLKSLLELFLAHVEYASTPAQFVFCSSTASVASFAVIHPASEEIPEVVLEDPQVSGHIGYSQSKWVAENICLRACQSYPELRDHLTIVRVGQVSGDTVHGVWNHSEAYPLMLSSVKVTGCLPDLPRETLDWIPVDLAAACFVELAIENSGQAPTSAMANGVRALHLLNQDRSTKWRTLLDSLKERETFAVVGADTWLKTLEDLTNSADSAKNGHPSLKLLDFWKKAYRSNAQATEQNVSKKDDNSRWALQRSTVAMPSLSKVRSVDDTYIAKLWDWIKENI